MKYTKIDDEHAVWYEIIAVEKGFVECQAHIVRLEDIKDENDRVSDSPIQREPTMGKSST